MRHLQFAELTGTVAIVCGVLALTPPLTAQNNPMMPRGEIVPRHIDSGPVADHGAAAEIAFAQVLFTEGARWQRLFFDDVILEGDSIIRFTSLHDGQVQELDARGIEMWSNSSAYFNGDVVLIEVIPAPGTVGNRFVLNEVGVEFIDAEISNHCNPPLECGICNQDDRVPSNENWAPRLLLGSGGGCSAAIIDPLSCVVSAGHCMGSDMVIQFNVPQSNSDCTLNHPPVEDQFPITGQSSQNSGVGADWAVMTSGTNNLGETAYERFGEFRPIAANVPSSGAIDVWGYGVSDDCTLGQSQQHSTGDIIDLSSSAVFYTADVTCGNSGSSLLHNDEIIGIVSHCTFDCPAEGNIATRVDVSAFIAARDSLCSEPEDVHVPGDYATIQAAIDAVGNGSTITVAPGTYNEAINFTGKNLLVVSSGGPEVTTIDATGQNASVARFSSSESSQAVLDGFTLTGGTGSSVSIGGTQYVLGGGIYAASSSPTIHNCIITGNSGDFGGGVFNNSASPTFDNCVFDSNTAAPSSGGGAFNFSGSQPQYINTLFTNNTATANGGGMSSQNSSPTVDNCQFIANTASDDGGAVRNIQGSAGQFVNSTFESNIAGGTGGAFINDDSAGTLIADSTFCDNAPNNIAGNFSDGDGNDFLSTCPGACIGPADVNCDGEINVDDLLIVLNNWGLCDDCDDCPGDITGNCMVNVDDLLLVLNNWG